MNANLRLKVDTTVMIDQRAFQFARLLQDGRMAFDDEENGRRRVLDENGFIELYLADRIAVPSWSRLPEKYRVAAERALDALPAKFPQEALWRHCYCVAFDQADPRPRKNEQDLSALIDAVAAREGHTHKPDWRTLCRWLRTRGVSGRRNLRAIRSFHDKKGRKKGIDADVELIISESIASVYQNRGNLPPSAVYEHVIGQIAKRNAGLLDDCSGEPAPAGQELPEPSQATVFRRVRDSDYYRTMRLRLGRQADRLLRPLKAAPQHDAPLEAIIIDHTKIDSWLFFDDATGLPCGGRPWLTMALDAYSRYPLGYYIGFEPPSVYSVMMCLRQAIAPKLDLARRKAGVADDWLAMGVPFKLIADNGKEMVGYSLPNACAELGIELETSPVRTPHYKGIIERFFGTMNTRFIHRLPGTTFGDARKLKALELNPQQEMCISFLTFESMFLRWLVKDYARSRNRSMGTTPEKRWIEGTQRHRVELPARMGDLAHSLSRYASRSISREGIRFKGLTYRNDNVVRTILASVRAPRVDVDLRFDPTDLGCIYVREPQTGQYLGPMRCDEFDYAKGLSLWQHGLIRDENRRRERNPKDFRDLMITRAELIEETAQAIREGRGKAADARFQGIGSQKSTTIAVVQSDNGSTTRPISVGTVPMQVASSQNLDDEETREGDASTQGVASTAPLPAITSAAPKSNPTEPSSEFEDEDDTDALLAKYSFNTIHKA